MKILFATDGSETAGAAAEFLAALPLPPGSAIHVITVADPVGRRTAGWTHPAQAEWAERVLGNAVIALTEPRASVSGLPPPPRASASGLAVTTGFRQGGISREILRAAEEFEADLIAVGSRGLSGVAGFLLGSVARNVAHHAARPVLLARALRSGLRHVVLAVDDSENAAAALDLTASLPLPPATEIMAVHVVHPFAAGYGAMSMDLEERRRLEECVRSDREAAARPFLDGAVLRLRQAGRHATAGIREGDPAREILDMAEETRADLIVAGARGKSVIERLVVGSVADRLMTHASCSVLIVH